MKSPRLPSKNLSAPHPLVAPALTARAGKRPRKAPPRPDICGGFSLLEVLISTLFLTIAAGALLYALTAAVSIYAATRDNSRRTLNRWNEVVDYRQEGLSGEASFVPFEGCRPMYRKVIGSEDPPWMRRWEVIRAAK